MRKVLLVPLLVAVGCSEPAPRPPIVPRGGSAPHLFIEVSGLAANEGKQARCTQEAESRGAIVDGAAPVHAVLILEGSVNRLQIVSRVRGIVRDEQLPGWDMGRLCREALDGILPVLAQEPAAPPPGYTPPPALAQPRYAPPPAPAYRSTPAPMGPPSLLPPPADAPRPVAALVERGAHAYARGDYPGALAAFTDANRQSSSPPLLFDTAACLQMLRRPREALQSLQLYLERAPSAPNRADAERLAADLRRQLGEDD